MKFLFHFVATVVLLAFSSPLHVLPKLRAPLMLPHWLQSPSAIPPLGVPANSTSTVVSSTPVVESSIQIPPSETPCSESNAESNLVTIVFTDSIGSVSTTVLPPSSMIDSSSDSSRSGTEVPPAPSSTEEPVQSSQSGSEIPQAPSNTENPVASQTLTASSIIPPAETQTPDNNVSFTSTGMDASGNPFTTIGVSTIAQALSQSGGGEKSIVAQGSSTGIDALHPAPGSSNFSRVIFHMTSIITNPDRSISRSVIPQVSSIPIGTPPITSPPTAAPGSSISITGVFPTATGQHGPIASACIVNPTNPLCALLDVIATAAAPPLCGLPELLAVPFYSSLKATPTLAPKDFCQEQPLNPFCVSLEAVATKTLHVVCAIDSPLALDPFCPSLLNGLPVGEQGLLTSACVSSPTNLLCQSLSAMATSVLPSLCGLAALVNDPFCLSAKATPILDAAEGPVVNTVYNGEVPTWHSNQQMVFHVRPPIVNAPFKRAPAAEPFCEGHPKDVQQLYNELQAFCKWFVNLKCDLSPKVSSNIPVLVSATKSIASSESAASASSDEAAYESSIASQRSAESASHQSDASQFTATAISDNLGRNKGGSQFPTATNTNTE
ncbi:hypothetical protein B0J14DRAFT_664032 [Halenospora varia]|nr:hypothetical protein B0J14DRAFT_664032 [Halenospora varia]